jgi:hypothetical protein
MKKEKFHFTDRQRNELIEAAFKKRKADLVGVFLDRCEDAITEWRKAWPVKEALTRPRAVRDGLSKVVTELQKLRSSIVLLPEGVASAVLVNWNIVKKNEHIGDCQKAQTDILNFIDDLKGVVHGVQHDISSVGGISKQCEAELITELADVFAWTFRKRPSAVPNGEFMSFVGALTVFVKRLDGKLFIAGKDLVATAIKRKSVNREYYLKSPVD